MPKVKFKILSHEELAEIVFRRIRRMKENYKRNVYLDIQEKLLKEILDKNFPEVKDELIELVKVKNDIRELEDFKKELEKYWDPLNDLFFDNLKKITGFDLEQNEYVVFITQIIRGSYMPPKQAYTNPKGIKACVYITAEEILHLHYWTIYKKIIKNIDDPWTDRRTWEISEVIPEFIFTQDSFGSFGWGKDLNRNYHFIKKMKKKLTPLWKNKEDFKDFVIKIHKGLS